MVQRLVQKEKEAAQLRETIERMEKKYKDRAEFVAVSFFFTYAGRIGPVLWHAKRSKEPVSYSAGLTFPSCYTISIGR